MGREPYAHMRQFSAVKIFTYIPHVAILTSDRTRSLQTVNAIAPLRDTVRSLLHRRRLR